MAFQFRLRTVLNLRQHSRDMEQQSVIAARSVHAKAASERDFLAETRATVINELRDLNVGDFWDRDKVSQHRRYAEVLAGALMKAEAAVSDALSQLNFSIQRLVSADQAAQAFERLAEKQLAEFQDRQTKREEREFEDAANFQVRFGGQRFKAGG